MEGINLIDQGSDDGAAAFAMPRSLNVIRSRGTVSAGLVCRLIAGLGHADFKDKFAAVCCELANAEQLTAFAVESGRPRPILAYRPRRPDIVEDLCRSYSAHHHTDDAFFNAAIERGSHYTAGPVTWSEISNSEYCKRFFVSAGLHSKYAIVARHGEGYIYLNFYFRQSAGQCFIATLLDLEDYGKLLAEALGAHDDLTGGPYRSCSGKLKLEARLRRQFPILSPREVQVCARIVSGYSVEATALDLAVSSTTVTTFRRRAYAKLGISSQNELFACCVGVT